MGNRETIHAIKSRQIPDTYFLTVIPITNFSGEKQLQQTWPDTQHLSGRGWELPHLGGGSLVEHPQHWQPAHCACWPLLLPSSWYTFLQALLCHHSQQINNSLQHTKPTLTTPSLHAGVCSLPWFPTGKRLKIPPPVPRFSTNRACCD